MIFADDGFTTIDTLVVGGYLVAMLAMGLKIARGNDSTEDFFLGGRSLPSWAVGISMIASLLSTITYLGMPGEMFRTGVGFLTRQLPLPIVLLVVLGIWIPFFMRLNLTSAYEYLERRFNYPTRVIAAIFCILLLLGWISVVVLTASDAMVKICNLNLDWFFGTNTPATPNAPAELDADMHAVILGIGMFSVLYTTLGGLRAVVWTDVVQFFVLMAGAIFTVGAVMYHTGSGFSDWLAFSSEYRYEEVEWFKADITDRSSVFFIGIAMMFWTICTHGSNQVALQRYFSVKNIREARKTFIVNTISSISLSVLLAGVGLALMYFIYNFGGIEGDMLESRQSLDALDDAVRGKAQDGIFPLFIRMYLPTGLRGLVVAALFAAAMSTIDSGANSISTIIMVDFIRPHQTNRSAATELKQARMLTASMGVAVVTVTIALYQVSKTTNIIDMCQKGFNCFLGPLCGLFTLGMFSKRVVAKTAIPAVLIGELVGIGTSYSIEITTWLSTTLASKENGPWIAPISISTHLVICFGFFSTILTGWGLAAILRTRATDEQARWMWKPVVSQKLDEEATSESSTTPMQN